MPRSRPTYPEHFSSITADTLKGLDTETLGFLGERCNYALGRLRSKRSAMAKQDRLIFQRQRDLIDAIMDARL